MLMQTDACLLMHAGEYWCVRHVVDVFLEPHLQINYIDFIYFIFGQARGYTKSSSSASHASSLKRPQIPSLNAFSRPKPQAAASPILSSESVSPDTPPPPRPIVSIPTGSSSLSSDSDRCPRSRASYYGCDLYTICMRFVYELYAICLHTVDAVCLWMCMYTSIRRASYS